MPAAAKATVPPAAETTTTEGTGAAGKTTGVRASAREAAPAHAAA